MRRQNYYKKRSRRHKQQVEEAVVVEMVKEERKLQTRIGCRKLHKMFSEELQQAGICIGRDRFFNVMRENDLLVGPLPRSPKTTDSKHALPVFRNLLKDYEPTGPNQVLVSDITYLQTDEGYLYLSLVMDLYSRKVLGHYCSETLEASGCVKALQQAIKSLPADRYPIHHSDRGCQYCSHEYVHFLANRSMPVSMTEENHCYENSHAERLNGILKQEYGLGGCFRTKAQAARAVEQALWLYNTRRPHTSLDYKTPSQVHQMAA